jgi:hypothetical protein
MDMVVNFTSFHMIPGGWHNLPKNIIVRHSGGSWLIHAGIESEPDFFAAAENSAETFGRRKNGTGGPNLNVREN